MFYRNLLLLLLLFISYQSISQVRVSEKSNEVIVKFKHKFIVNYPPFYLPVNTSYNDKKRTYKVKVKLTKVTCSNEGEPWDDCIICDDNSHQVKYVSKRRFLLNKSSMSNLVAIGLLLEKDFCEIMNKNE